MKFLLSFLFAASFWHLSKANGDLYIFSPDSIKDTVSCAPTPTEQIAGNGKTGVWKMYAAPVNLSDSSITLLDEKTEIKDKLKSRKKIFATLLAFPVPFGIIGLHRIYLGTKPYVPLVYIATLGGAAGIVPFIDFIVLLLEKDISKYENNPNIIMWAN
ncbi:MAG: TM2 domain-containing protein [Bacteroidota bacterium]|nr:TM2 domain-containing protein [Bacteroidota bacterium]